VGLPGVSSLDLTEPKGYLTDPSACHPGKWPIRAFMISIAGVVWMILEARGMGGRSYVLYMTSERVQILTCIYLCVYVYTYVSMYIYILISVYIYICIIYI
jgi:hypothetical protein